MSSSWNGNSDSAILVHDWLIVGGESDGALLRTRDCKERNVKSLFLSRPTTTNY